MGDWAYSYDTLNLVSTAVAVVGPYAGQYGCCGYDSFGNRELQSMQTTACSTNWTPNVQFNAGDQVKLAPGAASGFAYDGEGRRTAKGSQTSLSCPSPTAAHGFKLSNQYLLGSSGAAVTELDGSGNWLHTNAPAGASMATYASTATGVWFHLTDPLGSRRILADATGKVQQACQSLPFGDGETCSETPTEQLFTGKERDAESGNDYFGARYYGSTLGRFLSPDWSASAQAVPYAKLENPQSLNLYAYAGNNPIRNVDPDGHDWLTRYLQTNTSNALNSMVAEYQAELAAYNAGLSAAAELSSNYNDPKYRLVATSDNISDYGGAWEVHWTVWILQSNGSVARIQATFFTDPKFYVGESQTNELRRVC